MGQRIRTTTEFKVISALALFMGIIVVATVGYDIYLHPPDPDMVGTATIKISGTGHFRGQVGTDANTHTIEGTAPFTAEVPFRLKDYVTADIDLASLEQESSGTVEIRVECKTVEEGAGALLVWKVPRSWDPKKLPKGWPECPS